MSSPIRPTSSERVIAYERTIYIRLIWTEAHGILEL